MVWLWVLIAVVKFGCFDIVAQNTQNDYGYRRTMSTEAQEYFAKHPVFSVSEFAARPAPERSRNPRTQESLLAHHVRAGHLVRIRRGLYAAVPLGTKPDSYRVDPYLVAGKMTDDAVLAYHTALELHGKAHSVHEQFAFLTHRAARILTTGGNTFRGVSFPKALVKRKREAFGVVATDRMGLELRVTTLERTFVDLLDRPEMGGGWEEIWRSLESVEYFDLNQVVEYALLLGNATTAAKVGFFLDQHREPLMVDDKHLRRLRKHLPKQPHYLERGKRESGDLVADWRLIVPRQILDRSWQGVL